MQITINTIPPITATRPGRLIGVGSIRGALSPSAENANCSITLDNGDGYFSTLFATPPLGISVDLRGFRNLGGLIETIFSGTITDCKLSATCDLEVEA
jgi:hypothetical protein